MYSTHLKLQKPNQIKEKINTQNPKLSHALSQGNRVAWLFLFELAHSRHGSFNLRAFLIWFTNPKGRKDHLIWLLKAISTVAFITQTCSLDRAKKTSSLFDKLSLQLLLELSIPLASKFSLDRSWNSCSAILPWTDVKLNQPSVPRDIPFIFLKYRKYSWQPSNFLEFPLFPKIYYKWTAT